MEQPGCQWCRAYNTRNLFSVGAHRKSGQQGKYIFDLRFKMTALIAERRKDSMKESGSGEASEEALVNGGGGSG